MKRFNVLIQLRFCFCLSACKDKNDKIVITIGMWPE